MCLFDNCIISLKTCSRRCLYASVGCCRKTGPTKPCNRVQSAPSSHCGSNADFSTKCNRSHPQDLYCPVPQSRYPWRAPEFSRCPSVRASASRMYSRRGLKPSRDCYGNRGPSRPCSFLHLGSSIDCRCKTCFSRPYNCLYSNQPIDCCRNRGSSRPYTRLRLGSSVDCRRKIGPSRPCIHSGSRTTNRYCWHSKRSRMCTHLHPPHGYYNYFPKSAHPWRDRIFSVYPPADYIN